MVHKFSTYNYEFFFNCAVAAIVPLQQETPVPMKKSQKDLENEREKSRIIHEFIAKTNLPLYSSNPKRLISTTRNEKVRSWFMETTSEKPQYYNPNTLAPRTTAGICRQPPLTGNKVSDNIISNGITRMRQAVYRELQHPCINIHHE